MRVITATSSFNEISTDQLRNRLVVRGEGVKKILKIMTTLPFMSKEKLRLL